ncbi:acetoacetate decarboxylase family protein [Erythrobacter westpacificensis]|uniref:Acetoacetate decarboxylase family protein n=1 Tax=Erythrobacter westpacificensis TaxID=1055231 RepID=A0ABP9KRS7_9SPHN
MTTSDDDLEPKYRMPISFGRAPGPRNLPAGQRHRRYEKELVSYTVSARTDAAALAQFLPDGLTLTGEPRLEISILSFRKIGWLAGRGYDILMVRIPAQWTENHEDSYGHFVPIVWENMADPIITGREELGWPKIFAEISVSEPASEPARCSASWDGHTFFEFQASDFSDFGPPPKQLPMVFEKYVPSTSDQVGPDAHYLTVTAPDGPEPVVRTVQIGEGIFRFYGAHWEQMPTQYPIVNALAALPLVDFSPVVKLAATLGGDGSAQRRLVVCD